MKKTFWSFFEIIETVAIAVVAVVVVRTFIVQPVKVEGPSMEPNFWNGDYLLVDELTYRFRSPERGEVMVFKYPGDHSTYYIKRVVGLPGERVIVDRGKVAVYGDGEWKTLEEPYANWPVPTAHVDVTLGTNEYFMMGDNRDESFDSRQWGPLGKSDIIGLVRFRLWPVDRAMAFNAPAY